MRIGNKKTDYIFKVILCMLIFVFSVTIASEVKAADSICAGHESFITEEIEVSSYRTEKNADGQYTSAPESQSGDGWIFAGWYKDAACTEALGKSVTSGTYVAKFVPAHVLGVKAQVSANLLNDDEADDTTGSIRFVTSLDSLKYSKAGFKVILHEGAEPIISASKYAYSKLYAVGSTETILNYIASDVFCSQSQYFKACTVVDIAKEDFDSEIVVTPFWITRDGTIVEGETVSKSVQQGIDACRVFEENEAWNLLRQSEGVIYKTNGGWGEAKFHKQYENFDLSVWMKLYSKDAREAVKIVFDDNKSLTFSLYYNNDDTGTARFDIMDDVVDGTRYELESAWNKFQLTEEEFKKLTTEDEGIELRIVRVGTTFYVYLDETLRYTKDYADKISATEKATVSIRHWGDGNVNKDVPFTITDDVSSNIVITPSENGEVTTDKTACVHGDTVVLTVTPSEGYYCTKLKVNGKEVTLSTDGTHTFAATESEHMIEAVFAKKVFVDNSAWDLSRQDEGIIVKTNGGWGEAKFCEQYENFDLSVKMKLYSKDAREAVKIVLDDNKSLTFSLYYNNDDTGTARFDIMDDVVDGTRYELESAWNKFQLTEEEFKKLTTEDEGIELRIVRVGTTFNVYLDGTVRYTKDYADKISATEKATVSIRHWGDGNVNKDVSFALMEKIFEDNSAWDLSRQDEGIIVKTNGGWGEAKFCDQYENFDLSVKVKLYSKDAREAVKIVFNDNKSLTFSLYYNNDDTGTARFDIMDDVVDGTRYELEYAWNKFQLTEEEFKKLTTEDEGIELRIVRAGTTFYVYLDETLRYTKDYADKISATEAATVSIRHWGDKNVNKDVPFTITDDVSAEISITSNENGEVTTDKTSYNHGDTVTLTATPNEGYYCTGIKVDGQEVSGNGSYSFTATKANYKVEGAFAKKVMDSTIGDWDLLRQDEGVVVKTNGGWGETQLVESYENIDLSMWVKVHSEIGGTGAKVVFSNNRSISFRMFLEKGTAKLQLMDDGTNHLVVSWSQYTLSDTEKAKLTSTDANEKGIEVRFVRVGTKCYIYVEGTQRYYADFSENIDATDKATVYFRHWDDGGNNVEIPFTITDDVSTTISITSSENGEVTTDKAAYVHGNTVVLTTTPSDDYYCTELTVDGKEVTLSSDGTYTFTATESEHMVEAVFEKNVFEDNSAWNLSKQDEGVIVKTGGGWGEAKFCEQYENFDLSVKMKLYSKDAREAVKFVFNDNKSLTFSLYYNNDDTGTARFDIMNDSVDGTEYALESAWNKFQLTEEEFRKLTTEEEGIELRIVRVGTTFYVYLDGTIRYTKDYSDKISATEAATVSIRHWGDGNVNKDVPFIITEDVSATISIASSVNGKVTSDKTSYVHGDTVVLTATPREGYYCTELTVDGKEVTLSSDGTYAFTPTKAKYSVKSVFARKVIVSTQSDWELSRQDEGVIVKNNGGWGEAKFCEQYENFDLSVWMKAYTNGAREAVYIVFGNNKTLTFSVVNENGTGKLQLMNDVVDNVDYHLDVNWSLHTMTSEETAKITSQTGKGIELRIVRFGTTFYVYLDGTRVYHKDFYGQIDGDDAASVYIRHWEDKEVDKDISFKMTNRVAEVETVSEASTELFYVNDKKTEIADPFVLDNTKVDGYYYLYGTKGKCYCYRSTNMVDWETIGSVLDVSDEEITKVVATHVWAPEVVYDSSTELYYLFFSATPEKVNSDNALLEKLEQSAQYQLLVAVSEEPDKNFQLVNFKDATSCGTDNLHKYSEDTYSQYYAKYFMLDPAEYNAFADANGGADEDNNGYTGAIDPHPYVDANGNKYLFWVDNKGENRICGVKMENWLQPNWDTATVLTYSQYYTVADWKAAQSGETVETVSYELETSNINEGPVITEHNGKYYLTFSVNTYTDSSYQVAQAVADSPLGTYRKLKEKEGGLLLSANAAGSQEISGTGHHSFVTIGEQTYIAYHRHDDFATGGAARNHAIDEVKWVKNADNLEVMYVNGPTCTIQPQPVIENITKYKNIAGDATLIGPEDACYLTDGLLSVNKNGNADFMQYIKETSISETTTFAFEFESARTVRAIMVYNSKMEDTCFTNISKIEFLCEENGRTVVHYINNVQFNSEYYKTNEDGTINYVIPGSAAWAGFNEMKVNAIRITVDVPENQASVGISEIKILGK